MAAEFLKSHGIDLQGTLNAVQFGTPEPSRKSDPPIQRIINARLPGKPKISFWDITISEGLVTAIVPHVPISLQLSDIPSVLNASEQLVAPSLCHSHIHLDKCFLLYESRYDDLEIVKGDFNEAMTITGKAKARFEEVDLLSRGRQLIWESIEAGVTAMRAFVEVDEGVRFLSLDAGLRLKEEFANLCDIQICVFAQLPLFSNPDDGLEMRKLIYEASSREGVDVIGSTPYVESDEVKSRQNIDWIVARALETGKHLDLHLDYNLDQGQAALVWYVIEVLKRNEWETKAMANQRVLLGHCTRLTLFNPDEWKRLKSEIAHLPISFVGLPASDIFMMARPGNEGGSQRMRGTLQIPEMIKRYGLQGTLSVNNVGNAFTPQGGCDPMGIACMGVGLYHAGTKEETNILYECVSTRAKVATGLKTGLLELREGDPADLVMYGKRQLVGQNGRSHRIRKSIQEVVYDPGAHRLTIKSGRLVNSTS